MNNDIVKKLQNIDKVLHTLPNTIGAVAAGFFLDRFRARNWIGNNTVNWPRRKNPTRWGRVKDDKGRGLLFKTGKLRRDIQQYKIVGEQVIFSSSLPYAQVHNEGFRGTVSQNVKTHSRTRKNGRKRTTHTVKAHARNIRQNIPKRQFLGNSPYLLKKLEREVTAQFNKALKS